MLLEAAARNDLVLQLNKTMNIFYHYVLTRFSLIFLHKKSKKLAQKFLKLLGMILIFFFFQI